MVKNDADVKVTLEENDAALKTIILENDDSSKGKLKTLEEIVADQGDRIGAAIPPRAAATADAGPPGSLAALLGLQAKIHESSEGRPVAKRLGEGNRRSDI